MKAKEYSEDDIINWYELYKKTKSGNKVAKHYGIDSQVVYSYFRKYHIPLFGCKKYCVNESFFGQDTPEVFYWAGFIAADGCVHYKTSYQLTIALNSCDKNHLIKLKTLLQFDGPIRTTKYKNTYSKNGTQESAGLVITSKQVFDDLSRFNIVPNKTKTYALPEWLSPHKYFNHFMRGYVDGDGSFFTTNATKNEHLHFSICGNQSVLSCFRDILIKNCQVSCVGIYPSKSIFDIHWGGNKSCLKIRDFLYKDSTPETRLDRKYEKSHLNFIVKPKNQYRFKPVIAKNIIDGSETYFISIKDTEKYNFLYDSVWRCVKGKQDNHNGCVFRYATKEEINTYSLARPKHINILI